MPTWIAVGLVIDNADQFGLAGEAIDAASGLVKRPGGEKRHLCELIPVYAPGGSTQVGGAPMAEASLHIRDVTYDGSSDLSEVKGSAGRSRGAVRALCESDGV